MTKSPPLQTANRRASPTLIETGIPWVGCVPRHWTVERLRWTITACQNGVWGDEPDGVQDIACIRVADFDRAAMGVSVVSPTMRAITASERRGRLLRKGDLLLEKSGGGELQPVGAVVGYEHEMPAVCSNFIARVVVAKDFCPRFLVYLHAHLYSRRVNTRSIKQTTGIQNLDSMAYFDERACWPQFDEQCAIAAWLDDRTGRIHDLVQGVACSDGASSRIAEFVSLLLEYRKALISAAVTGKLDVRKGVEG